MRWAKKIRNNYHSDCMAVLKTITSRYRVFFSSEESVLAEFRNLTFDPGPGNSHSSIAYQNQVSYRVVKRKCGVSSSPSIEHELAHQIKLLGNIVQDSSALGKVGMRSNQGPSVSNRSHWLPGQPNALDGEDNSTRKQLEETPMDFLISNLMEFHKEPSFRKRIESQLDNMATCYHLCRLTLKGLPGKQVVNYSFKLTESARSRQDFLDILAGLCLLVPTLDSCNKSFRNNYYDHADGIKKLRDLAIQNALNQRHKEKDNCAISTAILSLNKLSSSRWTLNGQIGKDRGRQYVLLRAFVFQSWLQSATLDHLRLVVLAGIHGGPQNIPKELTRSRIAASDQVAKTIESQGVLESIDTDFLALNVEKRKKFTMFESNSIYSPPKEVVHVPPLSLLPNSTPTLVETCDHTGTKLLKLYDVASNDALWKALDLRMATNQDVSSMFTSVYQMNLPDGSEILANLAAMECYSTGRLHEFRHGRWTGEPNQLPPDRAGTFHFIGASDQRYIHQNNHFSVVRRDDPIFIRHRQHAAVGGSGNDLEDLCQMARAVVYYCGKKGIKPDLKRSHVESTDCIIPASHQYRIDVGCIGQAYDGKDAPKTVVGKDFLDEIEKDKRFNVDTVRHTMGHTALLSWLCMVDLQEEAGGPPLAPDKIRYEQFAKPLRDYLGIEGNTFRGENITVVVGVLSPNHDGCIKHFDLQNDWRPGYDRTGAFNAVVVDKGNTMALHIQVIVNFRRKVGDHTQQYSRGARYCGANINTYIGTLNQNYVSIFESTTRNPPSAFDRQNFYLDDRLKYEDTVIHSTKELTITKPMIKPVIGPSRIFSLSMFIEPIFLLKDTLAYDQLLELCFAATFSNNPYWFHHILMQLVDLHKSNNDSFQFSDHPFQDWMLATIKTFSVDSEDQRGQFKWQNSVDKRFSPCGGNLPVAFGCYPSVPKELKMKGADKLNEIVSVLFDYSDWIDGLANCGHGCDPIHDMPLLDVKAKMQSVVDDIANKWGGLVQSGPHLRQLAFPVKGCASYNHLSQTNGDSPSETVLGIDEKDHDRCMQMIASSFGRRYYRDETETLLCESMHSRHLHVSDWFIKGGTLYDITEGGIVLFKRHCEIVRQMLGDISNTVSEGNYKVRMPFGWEASHKLPAHAHEDAYFYRVGDKEYKSGTEFKTMDDTNDPTNKVAAGKSIVQLGPSYDKLFDYFRDLGFDFGMMTSRRGSFTSPRATIFARHRDKDFFSTGVAFLPIAETFWTVIAGVADSNDQSREFYEDWLPSMMNEERKSINLFLNGFGEVKSIYKCDNCVSSPNLYLPSTHNPVIRLLQIEYMNHYHLEGQYKTAGT
ncbi:unnamed protein product [Cylindrotheca closterium]|uniref:Uncharacterized protein n=1 Tax=Cylindrotheca closterium TaxID=2856 RepID=A0AAD2G5R9_9STRA|nr:unnamed protein product [Cylindrotheca closterium]